MNQYDVAGLLKTYSEKAMAAKDTKSLRDVVRDMKHQLDASAIKEMRVDRPYSGRP